ncbi:MAG: nucleotidyltransferase [Clostridiales bacterium]|nr:nucleotidyltransferase [Clostridiales bacterium]
MKTTLLIMAAGIGSRYQKTKGAKTPGDPSAIKQLEPVGLHDEIIMDYSIHDAIQAGFNKIVLIIRPDIENDFKERIGNRIEKICGRLGVEVCYCFQTLTDIPQGNTVPEGRTKPWGTGQAVLSAKSLIHEPFAVINADDYYGKIAFRQIHDWLILPHADQAIAMAGFILKNTLSDHGGVTRGVCKLAEGHTHVIDVAETSGIIKTVDANGKIGAAVQTGEGSDMRVLDPESYVSMNFWGFPAKEGSVPWYMEVLDRDFIDFFRTMVLENPLKAEYLLPTHIGGLLREGKVTVKVLETGDKWFGVTYQEDKAAVVESIRGLIERGVYAKELYSDL